MIPRDTPAGLWRYAVLVAVVVYSSGVLAYALASAPPPPPYPHLELAAVNGGSSFTVTAAEPGLVWEDFVPFGCNRRPSGSVDVGDNLTGCAGSVALQYRGN